MTFMATPGDVATIVQTARRLERNPVTLAGKLVGFGADEQKAGIPIWAWITVSVGVGVAVGWWLSPKVREKLRAFE